jgi:transposase
MLCAEVDMKKIKFFLSRDEQSEILHEFHRNQVSRRLHRLHVLFLVSNGCSCAEAARIFGLNPNTILRWVKKYQKSGMAGLTASERPGRPKSLDRFQWNHIESDIRRDPKFFGFASSQWNGPVLLEHLHRYYGVELSLRQCQRILSKLSDLPEGLQT